MKWRLPLAFALVALGAACLVVLATPASAQIPCVSGPPPNDCFTAAIAVTGNSYSVSAPTFQSTFETNEPFPTGLIQNFGTVWYNWTPTVDGNATISTCTSSATLDTVVAVYDGVALSSLSMIASDDNSCAFGPQAVVNFTCVANMIYQVQVSAPPNLPLTNNVTMDCVAPPPPPPPPPPPMPLTCNPWIQSTAVNMTVELFAWGGDGGSNYTWSAPSGTPNQGTSWNFSSSFATLGLHLVSLSDDVDSTDCYVFIPTPPPPPVPPPPVPPTIPPTSGPNLPWRELPGEQPFFREENGPAAQIARIHQPCGDWTVTLDGSGSADANGNIASWTWLFEDEVMAEGRLVMRTYDGPGNHSVRLTTTDDLGYTAHSKADFTLAACKEPEAVLPPEPEPAPVAPVGAIPPPPDKPTLRIDGGIDKPRPRMAEGQLEVSRAPLGALFAMSIAVLALVVLAYRRRRSHE